jgi:hypothetical protein
MILVRLVAKSMTRSRWSHIFGATAGAMGMLRGVRNGFGGSTGASAPILAAWCAGPALLRHVIGGGARLARIGAVALAIMMPAVLAGSRPAAAGIVDNSDPELQLALTCGTEKMPKAPCEVRACFKDYLRNTPPASLSSDAQTMLNSADAACGRSAGDDEERMVAAARQCLIEASPCVAKSCYAPYMQKFGASGKLLGLVQLDLDRAQKACLALQQPALIPDGVYNGRSTEACGTNRQFGIIITVKNGAISWEHDFRGSTYKWAGVVGPNGVIRASVIGKQDIVADGQYTDNTHDILMHYPDCSSIISLTVLSRIR